MKLRIVLALVIVFLLGAIIFSRWSMSATENTMEQRLKALETKVAAMEKEKKNSDALLLEFADELALINVKVATLEEKVSGKSK